jgi:hypothetical protein
MLLFNNHLFIIKTNQMVQVVGYSVKTNKNGEDFVVLELQGDIVMILSKESNRYYASARRCTMASTFDEAVAATLIGKQIPGSIVRVEVEEYEFEDKDGEIKTLNYRYQYQPEAVQETSKVVPMHIDRAA